MMAAPFAAHVPVLLHPLIEAVAPVSGVWLDPIGWNVDFFPVDDFASPVPPSAPEDDDKTPGLDDLDRIILTSVSSAVERATVMS